MWIRIPKIWRFFYGSGRTQARPGKKNHQIQIQNIYIGYIKMIFKFEPKP